MNRLLGLEEFKLWLFNQQTPFNVAASVRFTGHLEQRLLQAAISRVAARHPALHSKIVVDGRPRLVTADIPSPAVQIINRQDDSHWKEVLETEYARVFNLQTGPLWHLTLLEGKHKSDLLLTLSHIIADGASIMLVLHDLFRSLRGDEPGRLFELPACEELIPEDAYSSPAIAGSVADWWRQSTAKRLANLDYSQLSKNLPAVARTRLLYQQLNKAQTKQLIETCRAEGTSVQGALAAAALLTLGTEVVEELSCMSIINLRSRLSPPIMEDVGLYLSQVSNKLLVTKNTSFWNLARDVRKQLLAAINAGAPFDNLAKTISMLWSNDPVAAELQPVAIVSNLGPVILEQKYDPFTIEQVRGGAAVIIDAPIIGVTTFADRLGLMFTFPENWTHKEAAEELFDQLVSRLIQCQ